MPVSPVLSWERLHTHRTDTTCLFGLLGISLLCQDLFKRALWGINSNQFGFVWRLLRQNCLWVLYRVTTPEPEPPGKHSGKGKLPFNRKKP